MSLVDLADAPAAEAASLSVALFESKLQPPWSRPGVVPRRALLDRLLESKAPIVAVVAPAGYGKTTLLAQWSECVRQRLAWVSLDQRDNDPAVLISYLAAALARVEPIDPGIMRSLISPALSSASAVLPRLASILSSRRVPFCLVLDHVEALTEPDSLDTLAELALHLPTGSQLVVASRTPPPLPLARLRAQGHVVDIGVADLAMAAADARSLLAGADVELDAAQLDELVQRTEGWPVGLYLVAVSLRSAGRPGDPGPSVGGADRLIADYLRSEVLGRVSPDLTRFLRRSSVLDRLSGPLCDAVVGTNGSARTLEELEQSSLLLIPLDHERGRYRLHHLLHEQLRSELGRTEPEVVPELHGRVAAWLEANGLPDLALEHAQLAADGPGAARLFVARARATYASGRVHTPTRWLGWFEVQGLMETYPEVAALGVLSEGLQGRWANADRRADIVESAPGDRLLPDGSPFAAWAAFLRAFLGRQGAAQMLADAAMASGGLATGSPFRGPAVALEGLAHLFAGDLDAADDLLALGGELCLRVGAAPTASLTLAERAVIAIERGEWRAAGTLTADALQLTTDRNLADYLTTIMVYAVSARVATHLGQVDRARELVARASSLRPLCTHGFPSCAEFLLQLARAQLELTDSSGALAVLRQAKEILRVRPNLGLLPARADDLQTMADAGRDGTTGGTSLTVAELRILPLLATHFSFQEIATRSYVSRNTVKSHAMSIYRKLGVSSRSEAIYQARTIGLLGV